MYLTDERFRSYYGDAEPGLTRFRARHHRRRRHRQNGPRTRARAGGLCAWRAALVGDLPNPPCPHPLVAAVLWIGQGVEGRVHDFLGALDREHTSGCEVAGNVHPVVALTPVHLLQGRQRPSLDIGRTSGCERKSTSPLAPTAASTGLEPASELSRSAISRSKALR